MISKEHLSTAARRLQYDNIFHSKNDVPKDNEINYCDVCKVSCTGSKSFEAHMAGTKHKKKLKLKNLQEFAVKSGNWMIHSFGIIILHLVSR